MDEFRTSLAGAGFDPRSGCVEFVADQVSVGQGFLRALPLSPVNIIPPLLHTQYFPVSIIPLMLNTQFSPVSIIPQMLHTQLYSVTIIQPMLHTQLFPVSIIPLLLRTGI